MKNALALVLMTTYLLNSSPSIAADPTPACGAVLCLAGEMMGGGGGQECKKYTAPYFAIQSWKGKRFKPKPTEAARFSYLSSCNTVDPALIRQVNSIFGRIL